jgi:flagellar FliL protein
MTMTNEAEASAGESGAAKPKGKSKLLLIVIAAVVLLGGGAGGYFFFLAPKKDKAEHAEVEKKVTAFLVIKDMMIGMSPDNAQATIGGAHVMKLHVALEIADVKELPAIQALQPRIEDVFHVYLREMRPVDLQGSAAILRLKDELMRRVNLAVYPKKVDAILIKELLVQ